MTPFDKLRALIETTPDAPDLIRAAHALSQDGKHTDAQIVNAVAADRIAAAHPAEVPDAILLRDVLAKFFLE